jgi:hypothetical protein
MKGVGGFWPVYGRSAYLGAFAESGKAERRVGMAQFRVHSRPRTARLPCSARGRNRRPTVSVARNRSPMIAAKNVTSSYIAPAVKTAVTAVRSIGAAKAFAPRAKETRPMFFFSNSGTLTSGNIQIHTASSSDERCRTRRNVRRNQRCEGKRRFDLSGSPEPSTVLVLGRRQLGAPVQLFQPLSQVIPAG